MTTPTQQTWNKEIYCRTCDDTFNVTTEDVVIIKCFIFGEFICERYACKCPECENFHKINEDLLPDFVKDSVLKKYGKTSLVKHR